jgi:hypothetical protein
MSWDQSLPLWSLVIRSLTDSSLRPARRPSLAVSGKSAVDPKRTCADSLTFLILQLLAAMPTSCEELGEGVVEPQIV